MLTPANRHELVLVGLSHETAPLAVRERCSVSREALPARLRDLRTAPEAEEMLILSTCNRTEMLGAGLDGGSLERRLREAFPDEARGHLYAHHGPECVFHLFSVCSGLLSMVVGEAEIQAQVKDAWRVAREAGSSGPMIEAVVQQALRAGKRVRTETELGAGSFSVAGAAADLIAKVHGDLPACRVLVIGAGETGRLLARHLMSRGVRAIQFTNRTASRAEEAAAEFGASSIPFDQLSVASADHDVIVASVEAPEPVLRARDVAAVRWPNRDVPKIFVDMSVPRAIEPAVRGIQGAFLFDLDGLRGVVDQHRGERLGEVARAERIVLDEARKFLALRVYAALSPAVSDLGDRFERARAEWAAAQRDSPASDVIAASEDLSRHLLAIALGQIKAGARLTQSEEALDRAWRRYREQHA